MAAPMEKSEKCLLCHESLPKKSRRSLFVKEFAFMTQLVEVLGYIPQNNDTSSRYVCTFCFSKLNKLQKLDYDIVHILNRLKEEKMALLNIMRARFLTQPSVIDHENPLCGTAIQKTSLNNDASPLDVKNIDKCSTLQIFSNTHACSLSSVVDSSRSINTPTFPADVTSINQTATLPVAILHCPSFSVPKQIAIAPKPMATSTPIQIMSSKSGSHRRKRSPKLTPDLSTRKRKKSSPTNKMAVQLIRSTVEKVIFYT
ncbi:hypothetical protein SNE40_017654 [Patella caerulea]|uniref:ZAD domain-containing protein n=1 Tax=Patella caerulea TaxID=87958 RepID=A0AAN8PQ96_PATCE